MSAPESQLAQIQALIAREAPADGDGGHDGATGPVRPLRRLCLAAARALPASGVGVSVMVGDGVQATAAASDEKSVLIEDLQFTLGEGPCLDAFATRRPVLTPQLTGGALDRWPMYTPAAHGHGVRAVFAFPLQIGAACLGVLDVYRERPGSLSAQALGQALLFAEVAMMTLLDEQDHAVENGPSDGPSDGLSDELDDVLASRFQLYQAQGMVMVHLGVGLAEAMSRLRAYAYAHERTLGAVARDVVDRRITIERDYL